MNRAAPDHASLTSTHRGVVLTRLTCMGYLGAVALCTGMAFIGVCRGEVGCFIIAAGVGVIALLLQAFLRKRSVIEWEEDEASARESQHEFLIEDNSSTAQAEEFARLLRAWNELERARGTPRFDAWAWQSLRTEFRERLRGDLELRRLLGLDE